MDPNSVAEVEPLTSEEEAEFLDESIIETRGELKRVQRLIDDLQKEEKILQKRLQDLTTERNK